MANFAKHWRFYILAFVGLSLFLFVVDFFIINLTNSSNGEIAGALGGVIGGIIGALGAAVAVYMTLSGQRDEDRARIRGALVTEVIEFSRLAIGYLVMCESIRSGHVSIPKSKLSGVMEMPEPIIFPALADRVSLLKSPQRVVAFYTRINENKMSLRAISQGPIPESIVTGEDIKIVAEAWALICQFGEWIVLDTDVDLGLEKAVSEHIVSEIRESVKNTVQNFKLDWDNR